MATVVAAREAGVLAPVPVGQRDILLVANNAAEPDLVPAAHETPGGRLLAARWERVVYLNHLLGDIHPGEWTLTDKAMGAFGRSLRREFGLGDDPVELVVDTPHIPPSRTLLGVFGDATVTVIGDGLMVYGPTRNRFTAEVWSRLDRLLYVDLVPEVTPLLLDNYGIEAVPLPAAGLGSVMRAIAPAYDDAFSTMPPPTGPIGLVLGQYLAHIGFFSPDEEMSLLTDMVRLLVEEGRDEVVFKPHPAWSQREVDELEMRLRGSGLAVTVVPRTVPAEVLALRWPIAEAVSCFSTSLATLRQLHGVQIRSVGTGEAMRRLWPFASSNRIPLVLVDRLARAGAGGEGTVSLQELVNLVSYAMRPETYGFLRAEAEATERRLAPSELERYLGCPTLRQRVNAPPSAKAAPGSAPVHRPAGAPPLFSVVTAVHDVAAYLPDFLASIDRQTVAPELLELVAVDDGSSDDSGTVLRDWSSSWPGRAVILEQAHSGQAAARNRGLGHATGDWVTFADPDDALADDYLAVVAGFLQRYPQTEMVATNRIMWDETSGARTQTHPLRSFFRSDHLIDLDRWPNYFHGSAAAAFFPRSNLEDLGLTFDEAIRPTFEDGAFCAQYLLRRPPRVGFVGSAWYYYRRRSDRSSSIQTKRADARYFLDVPRLGYLGALEAAERLRGRVPPWLKNYILYELTCVFREDTALAQTESVAADVGGRFRDTLALIADQLGDATIERHPDKRLTHMFREALLFGVRRRAYRSPYAVVRIPDPAAGEVQIIYRYGGPEPDIAFLDRGWPATVTATKRRAVRFFGQDLLHERIAWVRIKGSFHVVVDGTPVELRASDPLPPVTRLHGSRLADFADGGETPRRKPAPRRGPRSAPHVWVVTDGDLWPSGPARAFFRYCRQRELAAETWYVAPPGGAAWRQAREEFGDRLVAYGSMRWSDLLSQCRHVITSSLDSATVHPKAPFSGERPWLLTYLPPELISHDVSRQLNAARVDLVVVRTPGEAATLTADGGPCRLTARDLIPLTASSDRPTDDEAEAWRRLAADLLAR
jgi:glycosyltransferase involved in cell wall biosynthesis